jgi:hypothetical protein
MPFAIFGIVAISLRGWRGLRTALPAFAVAWVLGQTGLVSRQYYNPGLAKFAEALFIAETHSIEATQSELGDYPNMNPLEAVSAWTRKAEQLDLEKPEQRAMIANYIFNLLPFPSESVAIRPIGTDLSTVMGTIGSAGITTPSFAETYYVFGLGGLFIYGILGWLVIKLQSLADDENSAVRHSILLLTISSFPLGLHSNTRAMTRPIVYAFIVVLALRLTRRIASRGVVNPVKPVPASAGTSQ